MKTPPPCLCRPWLFAEFGTIGQELTTEEEKFEVILAFAQNKRNGNAKISVTPYEVRECAGVLRRYACKLIGAMYPELDDTSFREAKLVQTENGVKAETKALLVDRGQVRTKRGYESVHHRRNKRRPRITTGVVL